MCKKNHLHYSIISSDYALILSDRSTVNYLASHNDYSISDHIPYLPEFKIDNELDYHVLCSNISAIISIDIILFPLSEKHLLDLLATFQALNNVQISHRDIEKMIPDQENIIQFILSCEAVKDTLFVLSALPEIQWIAPHYDMRSTLRWANGVIQSGSPFDLTLDRVGLSGQGQIIGIADTGLDLSSCFFNDPLHPIVTNQVNLAHRKVIFYNAYVDNVDSDGHGTLVCSCAAGLCTDQSSPLYRYSGGAPHSKIAFFDIGEGDSMSLTPPSNLYSSLFLVLHNTGARVLSMSWGSSSNAYTAQAR
jgi:hypothetical protein